MKLVMDDASDRVLGLHMMGADAGVAQGFAVALQFDANIGIHPPRPKNSLPCAKSAAPELPTAPHVKNPPKRVVRSWASGLRQLQHFLPHQQADACRVVVNQPHAVVGLVDAAHDLHHAVVLALVDGVG